MSTKWGESNPDIAKFYGSPAWKKCRKEYRERVKWCERCMKRGLMVAGEQVHHTTELTPETVKDPQIALNPDRLELLCRECHQAEHGTLTKRWSLTPGGRLRIRG